MTAERSHLSREARSHQQPAARKPPAAKPMPAMLGLQRQVGNRAVVGLLASAQAKLEVGSVDDPLEAEADQVADAVVRAMRSATPSSSASPAGGSSQAGVDEHDQARRTIARMVQRRSAGAVVGPEGGEVDSDVESALSSARGSGRAMPDGVRRQMEDATGVDFGSVRLHDGPQSRSLNERLGATAFTVGSDIFFRSGIPDTKSSDGQHLLAHELAHTVQQGASRRR